MPTISPEGLNTTIKTLKELNQSPEVLITPIMAAISPQNIRAISLPIVLGGIDDEYKPDLAVAIIEKQAFKKAHDTQEESSENTFCHGLNLQRSLAIKAGLILPEDRMVVSIIAHPYLRSGVEVKSLILSAEFHGKGIGRDFYKRFSKYCQEMGHTYLYGDHSYSEKIGFFLNDGAMATDKLSSRAFNPRSDAYLGIIPSSRRTVKFLNDNFARIYLAA